MNYLILKRRQNARTVELRIVPENAQVIHADCEVWAIRTGTQMLDTYGSLIRKLRTFYMSGNLDNGAVYVIDYEDAIKVLCHVLGPSDRMRCALLEFQAKADVVMRNRARTDEIEQFLTDFCGGALKIMWVVLAGTFKVIWYCVLTILFMRWMHRKKR